MVLTLKIAVWGSLGLVLYVYAAYPIVIWALSRAFGRTWQRPAPDECELPRVSVLISALNEEAVIGPRIENILAQNYPEERLEIVVASDGSIDRTNAIVADYAHRFPGRVRLLAYPQRRGKAAVLNNAFGELKSDVVVLSDANTFFEPATVRRLAPWLADQQVSAVCGKLILVDPRSGRNVDSMYWRYETFLKECEGKLGALLGANGAVYAIRREQYVPIPSDTIIDDFVIPLQIKQKYGGRIVYEVEAIATEETPAEVGGSFAAAAELVPAGFRASFDCGHWPCRFMAGQA